MGVGVFEGTRTSAHRKVTLTSALFNQIDEMNPTLSHTPSGPTGSPYAITRTWALLQGTLREGPEKALLCKFYSDTGGKLPFDKKFVQFDADNGCKITFSPTQIDNTGQNSLIELQTVQTAYDPYNVNYNTAPNRATIRQTFVSSLIVGQEITLAPGIWYDVGSTASLRNALNNGICFAIGASDPSPKNSAATSWGTKIWLSLSSIKLTVEVADFQLGFTSLAPDAGAYVQPDAAATITWAVDIPDSPDMYFNEAPAQASFEIQYYTKSAGTTSATRTLTGTTATSATIPAAHMTGAESLSWRIRVTSNDGIVGNWSDWRTCTCVNQTGKATALSPDGANITPNEIVSFLWEHSSVSGRPQAGAQIQIKYAGASDYITIYNGQTTLRRAAISLAGTNPQSGQAQWRVRTQDDLGAWSAWSEPLYVYIVAAATAPSVTSVTTGTARPTVSWQSSNQTGYRVIIRSVYGPVFYDSGVLPGAEQSYKIPKYLSNNNYIAAVTVWNEYAIESAEGTRAFTVDASAVAPGKAEIEIAEEGNGYVCIKATYLPEASRFLLLRDGVAVGEMVKGANQCYDFGAGIGRHNYRIRSLNENGYSDSDLVRTTQEIQSGLLVFAEEAITKYGANTMIELRVNRDAPPGHTDDLALEATQQTFQGRSLPVTEFSGRRTHTHRHTFAMLSQSDMKELISAILEQKTLLYRDQYGKRYFCTCSTLPVSYDKFSQSFTLELDEVDYKEAIE